ncbi:acyl-CoA dehydrogenase family protein [Hoyosella subflava]|uniref:Acyl-CoA dehydrogenase domain protein n=1 Tax=Hoyosella subflava (strain DSM 45089 / JCM 17490 / NBRC 109087 / DQS3-9A1) TaxID=443218 RepID=F6EN80_HOYSD|nr:acyl-CoA dehydrogenase family protein [Hoyosella subflava]AEF39397.1 Acyl-CoA dehydrogenase domain protein [Hoyosella subflava DQS3-9A1]
MESDSEFRSRVRAWLDDNLHGRFAHLRGMGGPGREHEAFAERLEWERHLAAAGFTCIGWSEKHGGQGASLTRQVIFYEEYARAGAPATVSHVGQELLGPTLIEFGTQDQQQRFLPGIKNVTEMWCQGYSEPGAGSDLASVTTTAKRDGDEWVITGQKVWTSLAHVADWCFVLVRTEPGSKRHHGLSYLLVPMDQPGIEVRPINQLTGTSEFNEVFFDGARTGADCVVGKPGEGWGIAMGTLSFERGIATLSKQIGFRRELDTIAAEARRNGSFDEAVIRERIARMYVSLDVMRAYAVRTLGKVDTGTAAVAKLLWANWHRDLGELAMTVRGARGLTVGDKYDLDDWQRLYLFTRADTIYGGSNEIQRNVIAERVLHLPREVRQ